MNASHRRRAAAPVLGVLCVLSLAVAAPAPAQTPNPVEQIVDGLVETITPVTETVAPTVAPSGCAGADLDPRSSNVTAVRRATLCLLNAERRKRGVAPLRQRSRLQTAAQRYSNAMARGNFFAHVSPGGQTMTQRIRATGYVPSHRSWVLGENLGWGTESLARPRGMVKSWMESPPHRRNILERRFREIGIGVAGGSPAAGVPDSGAATYTTHFGALL